MTSRNGKTGERRGALARLEAALVRGTEGCAARRGRVLAVWALALLVAVPGVLQLRQDNSPEVFFLQDAAELARYRQFQMDFGRDRSLRVVVSGEGLWTREGLAWIGRVERQMEAQRQVFGVAGLYHHHRSRLDWPPQPESFRRLVLQDPLDRAAGWVTGGGEHISLLVGLYHVTPEAEARLLSTLEAILATAPAGLDTRLETTIAGLPILQRTFDEEQRRFALRLFPWLVVLAGAALWALLGSLATAGRLLAFVGAVQGVLLGGLGWAGASLDMVSILLLPLVFVISLATAVHVLLAARRRVRERGLAASRAAAAVFREKAWAVWWTGVTTAAGFGSLAVSDMPPVRHLGLWTAAGLGVLTLAAFTLLPALLTFERHPAAGWLERRGGAWGARWARSAVARRGWVIGIFALLAMGAVAGLPRLSQESSLLSYLSPEHPMRRQIEALEAAGLAVVAGEMVIRPSRERAPGEEPLFATAEGLQRLAALTAELRQLPGLLGAVGPGEVLSSALRAAAPGTPAAVVLERLERQPDSRDLLAALRTRDGRQGRVVLLLPVAGFQELEPVLHRARDQAAASFPSHEVFITGRYPLVLAAQRSLLGTMTTSLGLTFLVVALIFLLVLPTERLAGLAMLVNLWPVAAVLGMLAWGGLPVDSTTLAIAAVVLGLAVDDTFHTLGRYRWLAGEPGPSRRLAGRTVATLEGIAPAHLLSSGILAAGFALCGLSAFVPIGRFGVLAALGILAALAADLLLLPALLGRDKD